MKFRLAGAEAIAAMCLAMFPAAGRAQAPAPAPAPAQDQVAPSPTAQQVQPASSAQRPAGQVILHRSIDENGETKTDSGSAAPQPEVKTVAAPAADDAERRAVTFTELDLDVHLRPTEHHIAVRAILAVRNDGKAPLTRIPLQISSSLTWERIRVQGSDAAFTVATLNSDTDHTGQLHEASIPLATPLEPGARAQIDAYYSGDIVPDARRLLAIGAPDEAALHSDWDEIGAELTGLRGFGNVVWYPVSSVPAILGDGARVFDEIGEHKRRLVGARFQLECVVEYSGEQAPAVVMVNGRVAPITIVKGNGSDVPSVAQARIGPVTLGFEAPSLFVAARTAHPGPNLTLFTLPGDDAAVDAWMKAASDVTPFLKSWLGDHAQSQLTVLDLPDAHDAPFEAGSMLVAPIRAAAPEQLQGVMVHALAHAFIASSATAPAWLDEGLATFLGVLWTERQHGRDEALKSLEAARPALALVEPSSPGEGAGQPLALADSPAYYRTKAVYVLLMLRDIAGDEALRSALRDTALRNTLIAGSVPNAQAADAGKSGLHNQERRNHLEAQLAKAGDSRDLSWFFADWVDADKGLPDLAIESVFPTVATPDSYLVAVNVVNNGYAAAEVPITVRSHSTSVTERILIPARGKASRRILILGKPTEVQLNDGTVPETQASVHITSLD
jgi:hypothetical protein